MPAVMTLSVNGQSWELGPDHIVEAFFTTVSCRLEPQGRGTRFPAVMDDLYSGYLLPRRAAVALQELEQIEAALRTLPVDRVVWSLTNMQWDDSQEPVDRHAADSFHYFIDKEGQPLLLRLRAAVQACANANQPLRFASAQESLFGVVSGLVCALLGIGWMFSGRAWFPNWSLHRIGMNASLPLWTFGMDLLMSGAGLMIAYGLPGVRDWFRRHQPVFLAVVLIAPIAWLVICARAGYLPD